MQPWFQRVMDGLQNGSLHKLVLSRPWSAESDRKVMVRPIALGERLRWQWAARRGTQEFHENLTLQELQQRLATTLGATFGDLHAFGPHGELVLRWGDPQAAPKQKWKRQRSPVSADNGAATSTADGDGTAPAADSGLGPIPGLTGGLPGEPIALAEKPVAAPSAAGHAGGTTTEQTIAAAGMPRAAATRPSESSTRRSIRSSATTGGEPSGLPLEHNRVKQYQIPEGVPCPFLESLGVMSSDGRVHPTQRHKFRQINRYLEFLNDILPHLPRDRPVHVVDFGSGRSGLTFALYHWLTHVRQRSAVVTGLDRKVELMARCQQLAHELGFEGLRFQAGDIAAFRPVGGVDLAVSLHACDTATDDALAAAVAWQSQVIFAVPCCQHELSRRIPDGVLPGLLEYGLCRERFAAMATDALRARWLETQGYKSQVVEFIELEHTPKNVLIRAVRRGSMPTAERQRRDAEYTAFKQALGVTEWHLESAARTPSH
jgi:SAM-dependent methyltransferase